MDNFNNNYNSTYEQPYVSTEVKPSVDGFAIAGLIISILTLLISCCTLILAFNGGWLGSCCVVIFAILGLIFAILSKGKQGKFSGIAMAALIISIIACLLGILGSIIGLIIFIPNMDTIMNQFNFG